jgi:hypothetical protein
MPVVLTASTGLMVMVKLPGAVCAAGVAESVTVTEKLYVPAVVGLPEIVPEPLKLSPGGRVDPIVTAQVKGAVPPEALRVAEG